MKKILMDGYEVLIGDLVYDVVFGSGVVERLMPDEQRFWVKYGSALRSYSNKGIGNFNSRTLFWHDPILAPPNKNRNTWDTIIRITNAVSNSLGIK